MREFWLWYHYRDKRWYYRDRELHCGDCFQVLMDSEWVDTRIEFSHRDNHSFGWFLVTHPSIPLSQLEVRD